MLVQIAKLKDTRARDQGFDDFKVRILRRRADEGKRSILDVGEERILLGFVPAMDFIHEKDRADIVQPSALERFVNDNAQIRFAGKDGGDGGEVTLGGVGDDLRKRGLACAGRSPQDDGRE